MGNSIAINDNVITRAQGLGVCWIIYSILRLIVAFLLIPFAPIATVMFGALLERVRDSEAMMANFHVFYIFWIILSAATGIIGLLAGIGLLSGRGATRRTLAVIAGFLSLSDLPLGITLGIYTLLRFFPRNSEQV